MRKEVALSVRAALVDPSAWSYGRPGEEEGEWGRSPDGVALGREGRGGRWERGSEGAREPHLSRPWPLVRSETAGINGMRDS